MAVWDYFWNRTSLHFIFICDTVPESSVQEISTSCHYLSFSLPGLIRCEKVSHSDQKIADCWKRDPRPIMNNFACVPTCDELLVLLSHSINKPEYWPCMYICLLVLIMWSSYKPVVKTHPWTVKFDTMLWIAQKWTINFLAHSWLYLAPHCIGWNIVTL